MVFNSYSFAVFLPIFFVIYFLLNKNLKFQNYFVLVASLVFYSFWDYRFVFLLIFNTLLDYYLGIFIYEQPDKKRKKQLLILAVTLNLGVLFFFKYFNFFIDSTNHILQTAGYRSHLNVLNIVLPIGISFYTFHSLSYTIDIYHDKLMPTRNYVAYASFVCFFPQLVAGPISRSRDMLPKFLHPRPIDANRMSKGISQITLGFFKKIAIADSAGLIVDSTFANLHVVSDLQILTAIVLYSFQIYCDFSGYTDIALGLGKIFNIEFKVNFNRPYFARNFSEFWERWHISLSSWLRDYLYIPLGGNRKGELMTYRNLLITMLLGGLWHGASYNFIIWGALHGLYLVVQRQFKFKLPAPVAIIITYSLTLLAWVFFRSHSFADSLYIIQHIVTLKSTQLLNLFSLLKVCYLIAVLLVMDALLFNYFERYSYTASFCINIFLLMNILMFGTFSSNAFIYFQF